jgi:hypothetical protein
MKIPEIRWTMDGNPADILRFMSKHKPELSEPGTVMMFMEVEDFSLQIKFEKHRRDLYLRPGELLMYFKEIDRFSIGTPCTEEELICGPQED